MAFLMMLSEMFQSMLKILLSILSVIRHLMRQQLELAFEFKSGLLDTIDWGKKQLVDFDDGKKNIDLFDRSNNSGSIDVKMDGLVLEEK